MRNQQNFTEVVSVLTPSLSSRLLPAQTCSISSTTLPLRLKSMRLPSTFYTFLCFLIIAIFFVQGAVSIQCYSCPSDVTPAVCAANMTVSQCPVGMRYCLEVGEVYTKMPQNNRLYLSCSDSCYPYNHIYPSQGSQRYARCCSIDFCNSAVGKRKTTTTSVIIKIATGVIVATAVTAKIMVAA